MRGKNAGTKLELEGQAFMSNPDREALSETVGISDNYNYVSQ